MNANDRDPKSMMRSRTIRIGFGLVSAAVCIVCLGWLVWRNKNGWTSLWGSFDAHYLAIAFLGDSLTLFSAGYAWHRIVGVSADERQLSRNVRVYVTTAFARRLPGSIWGPAARMYWYQRLGGDWRTVGLASVLEVWALTVAGASLALIGAAAYIGSAAKVETWVALALILLVMGALFTPRVKSLLFGTVRTRLQSPESAITTEPPSAELLRWVLVELMTWIFGGLMLAAILRSFTAYDISLIPRVLAIWAAAGTVGMLITFVPGGFGVVELALTGLLSLIVPTPIALATALGLRVFVTASELLWMTLGVSVPTVAGRLYPKAR